MKLISCYIENFGAITKKEIRFEENLTSICEENGFGKTTLASFLEAMFYGMNSDRANNKEFGMRRHFNPFAGGKFGGNVLFSFGKDRYKIERYFDEKSDTKDSLTVYKNGELCNDFGDKIGEKLFGIDKPSFERTIFIDAHEIEIGSTGSINAKLTNFVEGSTDDTNTEKALDRLDKAAKEYKKAKFGNDLISKENNHILKLEEKIDNVETIKASLPEKYERLAGCEDELKNLRRKIDANQKTALELKDWEQYDNLISAAEQAERTAEEIKRKYPGGIPSSDEVSAIRNHISVKTTLAQQTTKALSYEDTEMLSKLQKKYDGRLPAETEISDINAKISLLTQKEAEIHAEENVKPTEDEIALCKKFENHTPTEEELVQIDAAVGKYEQAEKAYTETPDYIVERTDHASAKHQGSKKKYLIIAVIASLIAVAGIGILFVQMIPGVILLAVGAVCLLATGFIYLNKKTSAPVSDTVQKINPEKAAKERIKNNAEFAVQKLLAPYGYSSDKNIQYSVSKLKDDVLKYNNLVRKDSEKAEALAGQRVECAQLDKEISDYFSIYNFTDGDFGKRLFDLRKELGLYATLKNTLEELDKQNAGIKAQLAEHEKAIDDFCIKYRFDKQITDHIRELEDEVTKCEQAERDYAENIKKAKRLKEEKKLDVRPAAPEGEDAEMAEERIKSINNEISALNLEISNDETEAEKLDELYAEKQRHEELLKKYKHDHDLLIWTADLLKEADKRLKDRYVAPVKNNFVNYAGLLETALGEKVTMTPNFEIRYERNGIERSEKHLSAGQRSICAFCFRMALIDNMYTEEKPFLILDDPFVNLDQKHMDRVKEMLKKLSEKLQLIYFTCHESRAI